jgi:hypothetical protein
MDVGWTACGQKTLSHCIPIPNSDHDPDWNIEKIGFLVLILGVGLFPPFF